ncbi:MAG: HlyD family efflux transporter periplasmic adaptor subunit [Rhodospirillum sp.]|nr:HlyD family efflux transporter periplasmic adaptor subunit [Rhodospirillum sp.]MCF8488104.1 HlyD family efflux transporter periplasmic adaptor subunit [Rhodospirillum sp.]MCF8501570.1 HlyD family efflux transporter periplasmic adaptor subunit [Rhodospirillum sp.]
MNAPARGSDDGLEETGGAKGQASANGSPSRGGITEDRIPYAPEHPTGDGAKGSGAGAQRRHERVTAPLDIIFQRKIYKAKDWSMTGFALEPDAFDLPVGQRFRFHARFHLRGAQMAAEFQAEVARRTSERTGCRFVETTPDQIQVLRMLLAAYRSGRVPAWEAMMAMDEDGPLRGAPRRAVTPTGEDRFEDADAGEQRAGGRLSWRPSVRMIYGILAIVALVAVTLVGITRLSHDLESAFAAVSLPGGQTLAADREGIVAEVLAAPGDLVGARTLVLRLTPTGAEASDPVPVLSPCACSVLSLAVSPGDRVALGDPLMSLGPINGAKDGLFVEALFPMEDLEDLPSGTQLEVRLAGTNRLVPGRVVTLEASLSALPAVLVERGGLGVVQVRLDQAPEGLYNGQPARVRLRRSPLVLLGL